MLCHLHHVPRHMLWKKTEGYQLWWSICWWVRVQAVSVEGGCSVFKGGREFGQGGQIPALLDHHHLHLHLHLLHNHLQCLQCLLHPDWWQRVRLIYQLDLRFIFCNVWLIYILWTQTSLYKYEPFLLVIFLGLPIICLTRSLGFAWLHHSGAEENWMVSLQNVSACVSWGLHPW